MPSLLKRGGEYSTPTTVLGFYAGVLAIVEVGVVGVLGVLASNRALHHLIPWVLGFGAVVLVTLIAVVVAMNIRNPSKLQLGKVTAREYIEVQRMTLGDSIAGEYIDEVPTLPERAVVEGSLIDPPDDRTADSGPAPLDDRSEDEDRG